MKKHTFRKLDSKSVAIAIIAFITISSSILVPHYITLNVSAESNDSPSQPPPTVDTSSFSMAPVNPEFTDYIDNPPASSTGYVPPTMDFGLIQKTSQIATIEGLSAIRANPGLSYFDWRDTGNVTSVKDQNPCGTCWAFSTLSAVEARVLIEESTSYDFSEQNLVCCTDPSIVVLHDNRCNAGGNSIRASDTLAKKGTRLESCQPYNTGTINTEICNDGCTTIKVLTGYRLITDDGSDVSIIKDAVYDHGPVSISYCHDDNYLYDGNIYYWPSCTESVNHGVAIVGWNDSIPHPYGGGSGAWIVKNNWGTSWGNSGYFYLCYGSANVRSVASYQYKDYDSDETLYYWDEAGLIDSAGGGVNYGWMANVFNSAQDGNITHVDFWAPSSNAQYQIYIYDGNFSTTLTSQSGTCSEAGYYSIPLDTPVYRNTGQQFTVAVKITTPGYNYPLPIEYVITDWFEPAIQSGVSYLRIEDGDPWEDASSYSWNVCLRARIVDYSFTLTLNASPPAGGNPTGAGNYSSGDNASISANTSTCYTFTGWTPTDGVANASSEDTTVSMTQNRSLTANFAPTGATYNLTISSSEYGNVTTPGEGIFGPYDCSKVVNLLAEPDLGYEFVSWSGNISTIADPYSPSTTIIAYDNYSITANFGQPPTGFYGDANGDSNCNIGDYAFVRRMIFGKESFDPGGDTNRDGNCNIGDYAFVRRMIFGKEPLIDKYESSYDFLSGADSDKWAVNKTISSIPPPANHFDNESGWTVATPTDYSNISLTDDNVWTITGTPGNYSALQCKFTVINNPADITSIGVTLNGSSNIDAAALRFYAWNFNTDSWTQIGTDFTMTTSIATYNAWTAWGKVYSDYIDGSQHMFILAALNTTNANLNVDYIKLSTTYP